MSRKVVFLEPWNLEATFLLLSYTEYSQLAPEKVNLYFVLPNIFKVESLKQMHSYTWNGPITTHVDFRCLALACKWCNLPFLQIFAYIPFLCIFI